MEIGSTLTKLPFWAYLSGQERTLTKCGTTHRAYEKGVYIFDYSDSCMGMVYIQKGSVRIYITSEEGREVTLFHISQGDCCVFSSACVIGGITLDVQMVAESEVELLAIGSGTVAKLMESNIHFKCFVYELSANRYSTVVWVMQQILFAHFDERMARLLLSVYEKTGDNTIRMTQEAMAQEVNSAREVVARMLRRFESDGLIELNRGIVVLKNIESLKKLSNETQLQKRDALVSMIKMQTNNFTSKEDSNMSELKITKENIEQVLRTDIPVLIDFWATWCGPCRMMSSAVAELADEYQGKAIIGKVNVDEEPELAASFGVAGIPMFVVMKSGKIVNTKTGAMPKTKLEAMLK